MPATKSWYDSITNAAAPIVTPPLVMIAPAFKPLYGGTDATFGVAKGPEPSTPIVVFASRTIKDEATYKSAFASYAEKVQAEGAGVRMLVSFMSTETEKPTAMQLAWYDAPTDYVSEPAALKKCYAGSAETDHCQVWGGWDEALKAKMSDADCHYAFVKPLRGFLKDLSFGAKGFATGSPPMIWISKRLIKPGRMEVCGKNFVEGTKRMFWAAPAALGVCEYTCDDNPDAVWSLRVFNDFDTGFKAHFPVPSFILFRMVFNVIPEWVPGKFPFGVSFSTKEYIEMACNANAGNKSYTQYYWDGRIGPMPDFGKGF